MNHTADWQRRVDHAHELGKTHPCCVNGCTNPTLVGFLACRTHWLALPRPTRHTLGVAFRHHPELRDEATRIARQLLEELAA